MQGFVSLFRLTQTSRRMFWWIETSISCSNLSAAATFEHADSTSSSTCLQLIGRGGASGESGKYSPDTPGLTVVEDLGARAASPRIALPGTPAPAPHTTKSYNKLLALSPSQGPASATSALAAPYGALPTPNTSVADATTDRRRATGTDEARLLSSWHCFLDPGPKQEKWQRHKLAINTIGIPGGHLQERPWAGPCGRGLCTPGARCGRPRHHGGNSPSGR
jgi:hypothetical protein